MKWQGRRGSRNIEDRRSGGGRRAAGGIGGIAGVLILLAGLYFGFDTSGFVNLGGDGATQSSSEITQADERAAQFVSVTLADTEEIWTEILKHRSVRPIGRRRWYCSKTRRSLLVAAPRRRAVRFTVPLITRPILIPRSL